MQRSLNKVLAKEKIKMAERTKILYLLYNDV